MTGIINVSRVEMRVGHIGNITYLKHFHETAYETSDCTVLKVLATLHFFHDQRSTDQGSLLFCQS